MNILSFEITMPNVGSWNGVWTGAKKAHFSFKKLSKKDAENFMKKEKERNFFYDFGDGWSANICAKITTSKEKAKIQRANAGFMGYDWMLGEIFKYDRILEYKERKELELASKSA